MACLMRIYQNVLSSNTIIRDLSIIDIVLSFHSIPSRTINVDHAVSFLRFLCLILDCTILSLVYATVKSLFDVLPSLLTFENAVNFNVIFPGCIGFIISSFLWHVRT